MKKKTSPIWIPISMALLVVGLVTVIRPIKSNGIFGKKFDLKPHIGAQMPVDVQLTESDGKSHQFGEYFRTGRPVLFLPIFYKCNGVCFTETDSLVKMLMKETALSTKRSVDSVIPGRDFDLVVVSIHPKETVDLARAKKAELMSAFREAWENQTPAMQEKLDQYVESGIHYTVGKPDDVKKLTDAMGFYYSYDESKDWVNHPAAAAFLATSGKIVAYNTGSEFQTKTVRNNVHEAFKGLTQPLGDVFLLGCFKLASSSPRTRTIVEVTNYTALATVLGISLLVWRFNKKFPSNTLPGDSKKGSGDNQKP
ncbi:MAG: hypothetical protein JST51_10435 [Armatimonadetes bacterium]|nr:hypothetical protein [Armatimonadota bacterium]